MAIAAVLGLVFVAGGFVVSNQMSWPLSQTVGGIGFAVVAITHLILRRG